MTALNALDLNVPDHAFLALLGPSDCADLGNLRPLAAQKFDPLADA